MSSDIIWVDPRKLAAGPVRHESLPPLLIERIKAFKKILAEVETASLDQTIVNFARDTNPEKEVRIWESIAALYQKEMQDNPALDLAQKKAVFKRLLLASMGA